MKPLPSGLPEFIEDDEPIARFLTQSGHFSIQQQLVNPSAFLPAAQSRETSVSRHGPEPVDSLRDLGVAAAGTRKLYGAAILSAGAVRRERLVVSSSEPPNRHAIITEWPWSDDDPEEQKARQKERALALASASSPPLLFNNGKDWKPE